MSDYEWTWSEEHKDYYRHELRRDGKGYDLIWGRSKVAEPSENEVAQSESSGNSSQSQHTVATGSGAGSTGSQPYPPVQPSLSMNPWQTGAGPQVYPAYIQGASSWIPDPYFGREQASDDEDAMQQEGFNTLQDTRYEAIHTPSRYYQVGRIFVVLGPDPRPSHYPNTLSEQKFLTRTFVVAKGEDGYSQCFGIHTYGGRATTYQSIDPNTHAPLVRVGANYEPHPHERPLVKEVLYMIIEDPTYNLSPLARIDFSRKIVVLHTHKVRRVGRLDPSSLDVFATYGA